MSKSKNFKIKPQGGRKVNRKCYYLSIILSITCLIFLSTGFVQAETFKFRFAHGAPPALAEAEVGIFIAERLNKETNGQIEAVYFHSGKMGGEVELFGKLQKGILDGSFLSAAISSNYGPVINILNLPFMFPSEEAVDRFVASPLFEDVMQGLKKYDLTGLGYATFGWYSLASIKPLSSFDQIQAERLKIRVPKSKMMIEYTKAMALRPTPISFPEVYSSLQQGVIDGLESSPEVIQLVKFNEVVKSIYLTRHFYGAQPFWVRDDFLNKLPDDLRQQFKQIVEEELQKSIIKARKVGAEALASFEKQGISVFQLKPEDRARFLTAVQPVYDMFADSIGKDYLAKVRELVNQ